jgi:hypothetical protein
MEVILNNRFGVKSIDLKIKFILINKGLRKLSGVLALQNILVILY